jgi:hypothetical protein
MCFWMMIAQDQKDMIISISMTIFTVRVARAKSANMEKSISCAIARVSGSIRLLLLIGPLSAPLARILARVQGECQHNIQPCPPSQTRIGSVTTMVVASWLRACTSRQACGRSLASRPDSRRSAQSKAVLCSGDQARTASDSAAISIAPAPASPWVHIRYSGTDRQSPPVS